MLVFSHCQVQMLVGIVPHPFYPDVIERLHFFPRRQKFSARFARTADQISEHFRAPWPIVWGKYRRGSRETTGKFVVESLAVSMWYFATNHTRLAEMLCDRRS